MFHAFPEINIPRHFLYADPEVGGGKTHSLGHFSAHPFTGKGIIAIQSIELAKEIEADLISKGVSVLRIDTDAFPYSQGERTCTEILNVVLKSGEHHFVICNHDVAMRADPAYAKDYDVYFDEVPPIYQRHFLDGAVQSHNMVSSLFTSLPLPKKKAENDLLAVVEKKTEWRQVIATDAGVSFLDTNKLEKLMKADGKVYEAVQRANDTDNYVLYWDAHINEQFRLGREGSLVLHSIIKPAVFDKFRSVTVLGAHFTWSLMYLIWKEVYGVEFSLHEQLMTIGPEGIRYQDLKHKALTTKVYCITDRDCSKTLYKKIDYQPTFDATHDAFKALMRSEKFPEDIKPDEIKHLVFLNNKPKEVRKAFRWKDEKNSIVLSSAARGWDAYKDVDVAIFLAACNEHPDTYQLLFDIYGLNHEVVDHATCLERAYQAVGRSSLRDKDSERMTYLIFFDYRAAEFVADIIGCGKPIFLDTGIAELSPKVKQAPSSRYRKKYHAKMIKALAKIPQYDGFIRRVWDHQKCHKPKDNFIASWNDWVFGAYHSSQTYVPEDKDSAKMYREGWFKSLADHSLRGNIQSAKVITFDFDYVSGDPDELVDHFQRQNVSCILWNSNGSRDGAWRFRIDLPLSQPVNGYVYTHIVKCVMKDVKAAFGGIAFILDDSCEGMHQKFYIPGKPADEGGSLFIDGTVWDGDEPVFLDVMAYMSRAPFEDAPVETDGNVISFVSSGRGKGTKDVAEILDDRACPAGVGLGWKQFYQAALDLMFHCNAKLTREEIIDILYENRWRFGTASKRNAQAVVDKILEDRRRTAA